MSSKKVRICKASPCRQSSKKDRSCKADPCRRPSVAPARPAQMLSPRQMRELQLGLGLRTEHAGVSGDDGEAKARPGIIVENMATVERERLALLEKVRQNGRAPEQVAAIEEAHLKAAIDNVERVKEMAKLRLTVEKEIKAKPRMAPELNAILDLIKNQARIHELLQAQRQKLIQSYKDHPPNVNRSENVTPEARTNSIPERPLNLPLPGPNRLRGGRPAVEEAAYERYMKQFQPTTGSPNQYAYLPTQGPSRAPRPYQVFDGRLGPQVVACPIPPYVQTQLRNNNSEMPRPNYDTSNSTTSEQFVNVKSDKRPNPNETASTSTSNRKL